MQVGGIVAHGLQGVGDDLLDSKLCQLDQGAQIVEKPASFANILTLFTMNSFCLTFG
jgi:hypothetical protein